MKSKKIISVIIPVYNTEKELRTCLDSLKIQDFQDVEFILIDDGSTDKSLEICNEYKKNDDRFVVIHKENGGPSSARNIGLKVATGEYITFVDSDDYIEPKTYSKLYKIIKKENPDILVFGANLIPRNAPEWIQNIVTTRNVVYNEYSNDVLFNESGSRPFLWLQLIRRSIIVDNKITFNEKLELGEDQLFQLNCFPYASKFVYTSKKFYNYRTCRDGSLMNIYSSDLFLKLKKHIDLIDNVFNMAKTNNFGEDFFVRIFKWSIELIYNDIIKLFNKEQSECAKNIKAILEKYEYQKYIQFIDIISQSRLEHILLLAADYIDNNDKIAKYEEYIDKLNFEIEELSKNPKAKHILENYQNKKEDNKLIKAFKSLKENGLRKTIYKIKKYLQIKINSK